MAVPWKGVTVLNGQVPATIKKYGAPVHTKPHGPDKTILYYEDPEGAGDADETEVVDYAGTVTPGSRLRVVHQPTGAGVAGSSITGEMVVAASGPQTGIGTANAYANPNDRTRSAEIVNPEALNPDIIDQETDALTNRAKAGEKGTTVQDRRPQANHRFVGGVTPWVGASADDRYGAGATGAAEVPFLDQNQVTDLRTALEQGDKDAIDFVLSMVPVLSEPAESETGADKFSELSTNDEGKERDIKPSEATVEMTPATTEGLGSQEPVTASQDSDLIGAMPQGEDDSGGDEPPAETESNSGGVVSRVVEGVKSAVETLTGGGEKTPEQKLAEAHPEWTYAFLDGKSKPELEELYEGVRELGVVVERTDGKDEPLRKSDLVAGLRVDK